VTDTQDRLFRSRREPRERTRIAFRRLVEALAAREAVVARVPALPSTVVLERPALELADPDVVQVRIDDVGDGGGAVSEGEPSGFLRTWEARGDAEVDRDRCQLDSERLGRGSARVRQALVERGIPVHDARDVEDGLTVAGKESQAHPADATPLMRRGGRADRWVVEQAAPYPSVIAPGRAVGGFVLVAFAATGFRSSTTHVPLLVVTGTVAVALVAVAAAVPWRRLPSSALLTLPLACDALVALLRHSQGGGQSGYASLLVLPVVWVAFVGGRRGVLLVVVAVGMTLILPVALVGAPDYPSTGWRGAVLLTLVAAIVGLVTEHGVALTRHHAEDEARRARLLDRLVQTHTALAMSDVGLEDVLETVVEEALALTAADAAVVELPDGDDLVYRAVAGSAVPFAGVRVPTLGSASGHCLATLEALVVVDTETDEWVDREACRRVGARSMVIVPLLHAGRGAGVLKVYSTEVGAVGADEARVLGLLGNVIGTGLARAELFATMTEHASTDALTGLANRRSWEDQLARAIAHAERTHETLSVAVCDVDGLKELNDRRGHAAGDGLLRDVAVCWRGEARAADLVARIGGDEFAVLLPGADEVAAHDVVERLVHALPPGITVSFGIAEWDLRESAGELMARADLRMYDVKRRRARASSRSFR
jgi:diguanylate cyclase (GGDEF)-like protein